MKSVLITSLLMLMSTSLYAAEWELSGAEGREIKEAFAVQIRSEDFVCKRVTKVFKPKQTNRGTKTDLQCDGGRYFIVF